MTKHEKVRVVWHDAHTVTDSWTSEKDIPNEPCQVETIGFLVKDKIDAHIVIAQSFYLTSDGETEYDGVLAIPLGMVVVLENLVTTQRELFN